MMRQRRFSLSAGMQRSLSQRQVKKVGVPTVPDVVHNPLAPIKTDVRDGRQSSSSGESGLGSNHGPNSPLRTFSSVKNVENGHNKTPMNGVASPRHRNSTGSNCSQASSGFESMQSSSQPQMNVTVHTLRGDSPPSRNSVHSSDSSSLGSSLERLDESGYASQVNIAEMILNGVPDSEVLTAWLHDLRYEEYVPLFLNAGYDLPTVARMTPEDLTAIGITKPGHRKRITTEIHKLAVKDNWPSIFPMDAPIGAWLNSLNLVQYAKMFESQGYRTVSNVYQLTWEDLDDIGVKKLGHLKKLGLAIKSLKDHRHSNISGSHQSQQQTQVITNEPTNAQVLVINVPQMSSNRNLAEVHPYAHNPASPLPPKSPRGMSTFANHDGSPLRRPVSSELPSISGYDTFPRRDHRNKSTISVNHNESKCQTASVYGTPTPPGRRQMINAEVVVHNNTTCRPTVTVRPQPTARSTENIESNGYYSNNREVDIESIKKQAVHEYLMQQAGLGSNRTNYSMLQVGNRGGYDYADNPIYANFDPEGPRDNGYRAPLSPRLLPGSQSSPLRRKSQMPPPPPKRAVPPQSEGIYCPLSTPTPLNGALNFSCDQLSVCNGLSPTSSMDEFPPPPSPLQCEASIRTLRSVMTSSDVAERHVIESTNGSSSTSSTETLAFAQENVGTIKSRGGTVVGSEGHTSRRNVKEIFKDHSDAGKGETLDDIDDMLQNLTAELNAMLTTDPHKTAVN